PPAPSRRRRSRARCSRSSPGWRRRPMISRQPRGRTTRARSRPEAALPGARSHWLIYPPTSTLREDTMPIIKADDGCPLNVEVEGPANGAVLMLSNSLGTNLHMWDEQAKAWSQLFRVVRYDRRGHGNSGVPKGPYSMDRLGRDVLSIVDALGVKKFNWC